MNSEQYLTDHVYTVIEALVAAGVSEFRPGHIADALREAGAPMLDWEIRGELARLEAAGLIASDERTGAYSLSATNAGTKAESRKAG
ncbi:MAG: hypothetical protein ACC642_00205 [Pseudomonadales bacterium]